LGYIAAGEGLDDPYLLGSRMRDSGREVRSASGTVVGVTGDTHTNVLAGGGHGAYNFSRAFNLEGDQRLSIGGLGRYSTLHRSYGRGPNTIGNPASLDRDLYSLGGFLRFDSGATYAIGLAVGHWGDGTITDHTLASTGRFDTRGATAGVVVGRVFTLSKSVADARPRPIAKARPPAPGPTVKLDASLFAGYTSDISEGFTDSAGFVTGEERLRFWTAGARAKLFATIPDGLWTWTPFVAAVLERQLNFSHTLSLPTDTIFFDQARTFVSAETGVELMSPAGVRYGVTGYYRGSSISDELGGSAYIRAPIAVLLGGLGLPPVIMPR
jgi:hypothetical protein